MPPADGILPHDAMRRASLHENGAPTDGWPKMFQPGVLIGSRCQQNQRLRHGLGSNRSPAFGEAGPRDRFATP